MVRTCGTCGAGNPDVNDACAACGTSLPPPAARPVETAAPSSFAPAPPSYPVPGYPAQGFPAQGPPSQGPPPYGAPPVPPALASPFRPAAATYAGGILLVTGLLWLVFPFILFAAGLAFTWIPILGAIVAALFVFAMVIFAIPAALWLVAAYGILGDKDWGPTFGLVVAALGILLSLATFFTGWSVVFLLAYAATMYFLTRPEVTAWYAARKTYAPAYGSGYPPYLPPAPPR